MMPLENSPNPPQTNLQPILLTLVSSQQDQVNLQRLSNSLQKNGGAFQDYPFWIYISPRLDEFQVNWTGEARFEILEIDPTIENFPFGDKVTACASAETRCGRDERCLIWFNPECLVLRPPMDFVLSNQWDAAFRPVHHQNIGSPIKQMLDPFWQGVYKAAGLDEAPYTVRSFVDGVELRPYYNTHAFSFRSAKNLMAEWLRVFQQLVTDIEFQDQACGDILHKIFLHQAVLSTLVARYYPHRRIHLLPEVYNYPLNLHKQMEPERRGLLFPDLVSLVYEDELDLTLLAVYEEYLPIISLDEQS